VPELVARPALAQAVTLNSLGVNIARATGPALGGLVIAVAGSWAVFALNAVSVPETSKRAATFVIGSAQTSR
jgi:hypothetical protein